MIGDQALQHFGKPFGWALAADALHADARAFAEEEDLVREELGFRELGLAAERDEPFSETALEFLDHPSRRMVLIRELCGSVEKGATALRQIELPRAETAHPAEKLSPRVARMSPGVLNTAAELPDKDHPARRVVE